MTKKVKNVLKVQFPDKLASHFLFEQRRYKVCYGGRGSGKSWGYARALLILGYQTRLQILCAREVQESIRQSVHKLLGTQIDLLGLNGFYRVNLTNIVGKNGTEFNFSGLSTMTADNIRSYEGVDICWCEEAHSITKRSWDILDPTIRKPGSEVWITFNPYLESDETYQRFVVDPPEDTVKVKMNWRDNPWFPEVLEKQRQYCLRHDPDNYLNIWEGECLPAVEGAVYYNEIVAAQSEGRICAVPYDPMLKVHIVMDLGWNDAMAIGLVQKYGSQIRFIDYIEDDHKTLAYYSSLLKSKPYAGNWGKVYLPHDGYAKDVKTGMSTETILKRLGWDVLPREELTEVSREEGIRITRMKFGRFFFDKTNCDAGARGGKGSLIEALKRYRRKVANATQEPSTPVHDWASHGSDMIRYAAIMEEDMTNEDVAPPEIIYQPGYEVLDPVVGY